MNKLFINCIVSCLLIISCTSLEDMDPQSFTTATLFGMVYDYDNQQCANVNILVDGKEGPATDINGRFAIPSLNKGNHEIQVIKDGYEEMTFDFNFSNRTQVLHIRIFSANQIITLAEKSLDNRHLMEAENYLKRAEKIDPENPQIFYLKAIIMLKRNKPQEALAILEELSSGDYIDPYVILTMADILQFHLDRLQDAAILLEQYLTMEENLEIQQRLESLKATIPKEVDSPSS